MSSDFGLMCNQCSVSIVPDQMKRYDAISALDGFDGLSQMAHAYFACSIGVEITWDGCYLQSDMFELLKFAREHDGHPISIVDEHGNKYLLEGNELIMQP